MIFLHVFLYQIHQITNSKEAAVKEDHSDGSLLQQLHVHIILYFLLLILLRLIVLLHQILSVFFHLVLLYTDLPQQ